MSNQTPEVITTSNPMCNIEEVEMGTINIIEAGSTAEPDLVSQPHSQLSCAGSSRSDRSHPKKSGYRGSFVQDIQNHISTEKRSPFVKYEKTEKVTPIEKWSIYIFNKIVNNIPMGKVKQLTFPRMITFGFLSYCVTFGLFFYFASTGYLQSRKEEFVSLKENAGICTEVKKPVTGLFIGSSNGKWEGDIDFMNSLGAYEFDFSSLKTTNEGFAEELRKLQFNELTVMAEYQQSFPLPYNLLIWMHFSTYFTVADKVQSFGFTAEPGDIFNREYFLVTLAGQSNCFVNPLVTFDPTYGRASVQYSYTEYMDGCEELADPNELGYDKSYDGDIFSLDMDVVSMTSALAVNMGILNKSHLQTIGDPVYMTPFNTEHLYQQKLYDPRFPRMSPLLCFELKTTLPSNDDADDYFYDDNFAGDDYVDDQTLFGSTNFENKCVLRLGSKLLIPALFHYYPVCQFCDSNSSNSKTCNGFDLVISYIYFEDDNLNKTIQLLNKYPNAKELNDAAYLAYDKYDFSFCDNDCALLSLNAYDDSDHFVSPDFYSLNNGHCSDSTSKEAFEALGATPPTDLVEEYYRCKNSRSTSFFKSVAMANSNMMLFSPFFFLFLLTPLMTIYHQYIVKEPLSADEYSDNEREKAVKVLMTQLLKLSHGQEGVEEDPNLVLVQLAEELKRISVRDSVEKRSEEGK